MKKKIAVLVMIMAVCGAVSGCTSEKIENNNDVFNNYYLAADFNKTINMTVDYSFTSEESTSSNHAESLIKICGNEMSFNTNSTVKASTEDEDINNSIKAYVNNDNLYYEVNGNKLKEACTVKQAVYMLNMDYALFDESYCDNVNYNVKDGNVVTEYTLNPDMVLLNWDNTFFTLYNGLGVSMTQIQSIDKCNITTSTKDGRIMSYIIDFAGDVQDGEGSVKAAYRLQMDMSDYGKTTVDKINNLEEYKEQDYDGGAQLSEEDLSEYREISPEELTVIE